MAAQIDDVGVPGRDTGDQASGGGCGVPIEIRIGGDLFAEQCDCF